MFYIKNFLIETDVNTIKKEDFAHYSDENSDLDISP